MHIPRISGRTAPRVLALLGALATAALLMSAAVGQEDPAAPPPPPGENQECLACHEAVEPTVDVKVLAQSPHKDVSCKSCHASITAAPHTPEMLASKPECGMCHAEAAEGHAAGVHAKPSTPDKPYPTCASCHGGGQDPHAIKPVAAWTKKDRVAVCADCHSRQGSGTASPSDVAHAEAVESYYLSFHGKALLRFGNEEVAICSDCHRSHDVLSPDDPKSPVNRANVAATCGKAGCHPGAKMNFAMSGANHLGLKLRENVVLRYELLFFRLLIVGVLAGMLVMVGLDLRMQLFGPHPPRSGRLVAALVGVGFLGLVATIGLATLEVPGALPALIASVGALALGFVAYWLRGGSKAEEAAEPQVERMPAMFRIHHALLALTFILLAITGLPMRFALTPGVENIYAVFGGLEGARMVHRAAALVLILTWVWHVVYLLGRWAKAGWSLKSWTMLPNLQDVRDVFQTLKYYLGLSKEEPRFGRYQFREKADYLAEYWGMPIMILSGIVLMFPVTFGNMLPEIGVSFAYIAHSYEATLAFLAIVTWHMYNAHFNPATFPMNPVWLTGKMSRSAMEREHPLELAEMDAASEGRALEG